MKSVVRTTRNFKPAWWLHSRHLQTLWSPFFRRFKQHFRLRRERIELSDGDFIDLDWSPRTEGPIVLVLHGLEGSANSPYAKGLLNACHLQGWRAAVMHFRGCSGEANRLPRAYHSGDTADVAEVVRILRLREPRVAISAIGVSLGGNVLLKWLGETGNQNPLVAAIAISVPFDLAKSVEFLRKGFSRLYDRHLLMCLKRKFSKRLDNVQLSLTVAQLLSFKSLKEFDDNITAPLHGFVDAADYYFKSSCRPHLLQITVPTLIVNALDDPFVPHDVVPKPEEVSPKVTLLITRHGGHVGFVSGVVPWRPRYWLEGQVISFFGEYL